MYKTEHNAWHIESVQPYMVLLLLLLLISHDRL